MKILILGTPRSGSTSLTKFIDSHLNLPNYKMLIEPFNRLEKNPKIQGLDWETIEPLLKYDNLLVKNLLLVGYDEYPVKSFVSVYEYLEWCNKFFDKVIILDRIDKIAQSESFAVNETLSREKGIGWHVPKVYDITKIENSYIEDMINRYTQSSNILHNFSTDKKYPVFYYEDIFLDHDIEVVKNMCSYLEIEFDVLSYNKYILSPEGKVRIEPNNKKII